MNPEREISHHRVQLSHVRMHYMRAGAGESVVLLHGWPQNSASWKEVASTLAPHYTVVAPDMRGFGFTSKPLEGYDCDTVANDIYELVEQLELGPIRLVGHDWGAAVAYSYAAQHPADVMALVLLDMLLPGFGRMEEAMVPRGGDYLWLWHMGFQAVPDIPEALIAGREEMYLNHFFTTYSYDGDAVTPARMQHYVEAMRAPGALRAGLAYYTSYFETAEQNKRHQQTKLTMPVLAMGGEAALQDLPQTLIETAATDVRGGVIPRCGHWIGEENPGFVADALLRFFGADHTDT
jgi:pimeloyl-ACP methyl ester carboxylesterase